MKKLPKIIWIFWEQGLDQAPFLVKNCIASWKRENVNWEVIVLDKTSCLNYVDISVHSAVWPTLRIQERSNLLRMMLLCQYGGVWADATAFCMKPLDSWILQTNMLGFFVFNQPGETRLISNWFIASEPKNILVSSLIGKYVEFFTQNKFHESDKLSRFIRKQLSVFFNRNIRSTRYWMSPLVLKIFRVYPYWIHHFMFADLVSRDTACNEIWESCVKLSAKTPHSLVNYGMLNPPNSEILDKLKSEDAPVYKLSWKFNESLCTPESMLYQLFEGRLIKN